MKFEISSVEATEEETIEIYGSKLKPYKMKLEKIAGHKVVTIELETLEDLLKLSNKVKHSLVFNDAPLYDDIGLTKIEIYDYYRE